MVPELRSTGPPDRFPKVNLTVLGAETEPEMVTPSGSARLKPALTTSPNAAPVTVKVVLAAAPEAVDAGSQVSVEDRCLVILVPPEPMVIPPSATNRSSVLSVSAAER